MSDQNAQKISLTPLTLIYTSHPQGEDVSDQDAQKILEQIDVDGDATNLTFDEFVEIVSSGVGY